MKTTEEMVEVMQAFLSGKKIKYRRLESTSDTWYTSNDILWNWVDLDYKIVEDGDFIVEVN